MSNIPDFVKKTTQEKVLRFIEQSGELTPYLLVDQDVIREKAALMGKNIRNSRVFYAIKANADRQVLELLNAMGMGFEIASEGELEMVASLGVEPERIITSNTMKGPKFLESATQYGMRYFAFDSDDEVDKLARHAPGSSVYVRLSVPNEGSEWPLSKKFGVDMNDASELLVKARDRGLNPAGVTFHVGSQCNNIFNWDTATELARELWEEVDKRGIRLSMLNIGGGYPVRYTKEVADIETIEKRIDDLIQKKFPRDTEVFIEPGRAVVGDAGVFVATVTGRAKRGDENWLYIDVGVFSGLMESVGGIKYAYVTGKGDKKKKWILAGPSCDSFDVIEHDVELSEPEVGSRFLILSAGAYTTSYASTFNGFSVPKTILI
jgi:ornithine decarboxylase